ncbi:MAG: autotransporter outer membrane beta-barrel domain-containing protein [Mesorhizobium sp.]|uniref:autotransporter domain-containing protein n=1 Tax=Mesorhizobium sp. TaxID=1871066 RepID=UPI001AC95393|nr:autotransporter domain-containing protein [Mesorhizobium sp.]MBN9220729.1 autotransporter outer membrane beta-barrel domain-containing protein [Mesorhizobium sp.]
MKAGRGNSSRTISLGRLSVTTSTLVLLAIVCAPSTVHAQPACDPGGGPYTSGSPDFNGGLTNGCDVNANTADTFGGTVAATFRNGAVLNANTAGAVSGGLLQLPTFDAVINANVANAITGGTLVINGTVNALASGAIDGAWLRLGGDGVLNIGAANATTANTDLEFGSQAVSAGGRLNLNGHGTTVGRITNYIPSGQIVNGGAANAVLTIDGSALGDSSFGGVIADGAGSGTLALVKRGSSTLTLSGSNTYTGGTRIEAGTLELKGNGTLGAPTGKLDIASGATLVFDTTALTVGSLSGAGTITRSDFNPGVLTVDQSTNTTFSGAISDYFDEINGVTTMTGLTKSGSGTLTLSGSNTYIGTTNVTGGTLLVDGSLGNVMWGPIVLGTSSVAVASGGSLGGAGSIAGDVSVASGGTLLGRAGQTLSMGSLALDSGSIVEVTLGAPGNARLFNVAGDLTLAGTLDVSDAGGFGDGLYRLFDYGGVLTDNGMAVGSTPTGYAVGDLTVQTSVANQVNLLVGAAGAYSFWNGAQTTANNVVNGGTGTWSAAGTNWTNASGSVSGVYDPAAMMIFQGTPGTVTVSAGGGALDVGGGMQFFVDGYQVSGDALNLTRSGVPIRVGDGTAAGAGMSATILSVLTGSGGIDKTDLGTLILSGTNTYTGGTTISAGMLKLDDGGTLGATTGALAIASGGALDLNGTNQVVGALSGAGSITSSMSGGRQSSLTVDQAAGNTSYGGAITDGYMTSTGTGTVWLLKNGAGTLTLTGNSTFAFTTVNGGTLAIANGGTVVNETSYLGEAAGSNGTVLVTGSGSVWTTDYLNLGYRGSGTLTIADGGRVSVGVGTVDMVRTSSGSGTLNLNGTAGARGVLETSGVWKALDGAKVNFDGGILRAMADDAELLGHFAAGDVTIKAGGAFIDTNGHQVEISSPLGGVGALTKQGAGELYVIGDNTYEGGTRIEAGRLFLGDGGTLGAPTGSLFIASGATLDLGITSQTVGSLSGAGDITSTVTMGAPSLLTVDQATDTIFSGAISNGMQLVSSGGGSLPAILVPTVVGLTKSGAGTLTLTGSNSYTGNTDVTGGTLIVNGTLNNTKVAVASGAALGGTGTITGTVTVSGRLFTGSGGSGGAIGTMKVVGAVTFDTGSTYQVAANAAGQASRLNVTGPATINGGTVSVLAGAGSYNPQTDYTILSATGGVGGTFADVTSNLAFLDPSLSYDADNVYLRLHRNNVSFASLGLTSNQSATGGGAESLGSGNPLYDAILQLPATAAARDALDQLSGEIHASAKGMLLGDGRFVRDAATSRISAAFGDDSVAALPIMAYGEGGPEMVAADTDRFAVWGQAFGAWGSTGSDGNAAALDRSTGGLLAGADTTVGNWRVGLLGGYSHSSFDAGDRNSTGKSDNYHLGLYGGTNWRAIAFRTGADYSWSRISTRRSAAFDGFADALSADYGAGTAQVFGEIAYKADAGHFKFEPFANLAYVSVRTEGFAEQGGPAALTVDGSTTDATFATLGLRGSTDFALGGINATARGTLGWRHALGDVTPSSTVTFAGGDRFTVAGVPIGRDAALIETGLDLLLAPNARLGLSYTGQFGGGGVDQGAKVDLGVTF